MALADDYKARAVSYRIAQAQAQKARVQALIASLAAEAERRIDGEGGWGAAYLHLDLTSVNQETIDAVSSKYGREYLQQADFGFTVETFGSGIVIRWASETEIQAAVDAILNPPAENTEPSTEVPQG